MIRPITCLAFLLACGSGLYLYQSKHRVKVLDEQIARTVKSTDALREQVRMLSAEWTLLNDPERLRLLATQFLTLQTVSPNQFTSLADLNSRLPPPAPPVSEAGTPVAAATPEPASVAPAAAPASLPNPPPVVKVAVTTPVDARPAETSAAKDQSPAVRETPARVAIATPVRVEPKPVPQRVFVAPPRVAAMQPHVAESASFAAHPQEPYQHVPRPIVAVRAPGPAPDAGGSMLGMAHGMAAPPAPVPLPRPMPVIPPSWSYNNGG